MESYDQDAKLVWYTANGSNIEEHSIDVYVQEISVTRQEFYAAYQTDINPVIAFEMHKIDYEDTKHIDNDTKRSLYATEIIFNEAKYNISRTFWKKDSDKIELICT